MAFQGGRAEATLRATRGFGPGLRLGPWLRRVYNQKTLYRVPLQMFVSHSLVEGVSRE